MIKDGKWIVHVQSPYSRGVTECWVETHKYVETGGLAIQLLCKDQEFGFTEPYAMATVNIGKLADGLVAIKNYSENEGIDNALIRASVIDLVPVSYNQGMPIYRLSQGFQEFLKSKVA